MSRGNSKKKTEADEVEELLRAAEDDVFLNLSVNSHMARGSSTQFIDPDLDQRFQSLKSKNKTPHQKNPKKGLTNPPPLTITEEDSDDLFARFAALKTSLPSASASSSAKEQAEEDDDDDEVEKVIKWAIDAARLDPSPPSETDDDDEENVDDGNTSSDDDDDDVKREQRKAKRK